MVIKLHDLVLDFFVFVFVFCFCFGQQWLISKFFFIPQFILIILPSPELVTEQLHLLFYLSHCSSKLRLFLGHSSCGLGPSSVHPGTTRPAAGLRPLACHLTALPGRRAAQAARNCRSLLPAWSPFRITSDFVWPARLGPISLGIPPSPVPAEPRGEAQFLRALLPG